MKPSAKSFMHFSETDTVCVKKKEKRKKKYYSKKFTKIIFDTFRIALEYIFCT